MKGWAWAMWASAIVTLIVLHLFDAHAQLIVQHTATKTTYTLAWGGKMEVK